MFFRVKKSGERAYMQVVENKRIDGTVRQSVIATLGRADQLMSSGALAALPASGAKLCDQILLIEACEEDKDGSFAISAQRIGGPLLFGRLWQQLGIADVLNDLVADRAFEFAVERAIFVATLHRLFVSGSDRNCTSWMEDYDIPGADGLSLHHFYRVMACPGLRSGGGAGGEDAGECTRPALRQGRDRRKAFRQEGRSLHRSHRRLHGYDQPVLLWRGRRDARRARHLQGLPAGPEADDPRPRCR